MDFIKHAKPTQADSSINLISHLCYVLSSVIPRNLQNWRLIQLTAGLDDMGLSDIFSVIPSFGIASLLLYYHADFDPVEFEKSTPPGIWQSRIIHTVLAVY